MTLAVFKVCIHGYSMNLPLCWESTEYCECIFMLSCDMSIEKSEKLRKKSDEWEWVRDGVC
jgi:hypothetical protein